MSNIMPISMETFLANNIMQSSMMLELIQRRTQMERTPQYQDQIKALNEKVQEYQKKAEEEKAAYETIKKEYNEIQSEVSALRNMVAQCCDEG